MSDYVLHCTRANSVTKNGKPANRNAFSVLKLILKDGFLRATFAERVTLIKGNTNQNVKGPYPAACFTEQPLQFFIQSISANQRYTEFAVAVRKDDLFYYGGRPVIYSDSSTLDLLPDELKYLWVNYDPTAIWDDLRCGYPIDWTHEREWRVRADVSKNRSLGLPSRLLDRIVPIQLPYPSSSPYSVQEPRFVILVDTVESKDKLANWIVRNVPQIYEKGPYWQGYASALLQAQERILSFEEVRTSRQPFGRIEDLFQTKVVSPRLTLFQRRVISPFHDTVVHISRVDDTSLCGNDCSGYVRIGEISEKSLVNRARHHFNLCRACDRKLAT